MSFTNIVTEEVRKSIDHAADNKCPHWCYRNFWQRDMTKVECELSNHHEEDSGIDTHFSLKHDVAWEGGISSHVWFKEHSNAA